VNDLQEGLIRATAEATRPFVRRLLALGVPFGWVERRLRQVFIAVAEEEFALPGRRATDSRIALLTGINRKEVRRMRAAGAAEAPGTFSMNHVASLIARWRSDPRTTDSSGKPRPLAYQAGRGPSFMKLAHEVTSDLAPGVLLEHLAATGAVAVRDGVVTLKVRAYVPRSGSAEQLQILAEDPGELVETMLKNVMAEGADRLLQRKVSYDNIGADAAERVRREIRRESERFLDRLDRLLARYDRDRNPKAPGGTRHRAGVGVYFFEAPPRPADHAAPPARARGRKRDRKERA
jgi:hypothetical protein